MHNFVYKLLFHMKKDIEIDQRSLNKLYFVLRIDKPSYSNDKSVVRNGNY